MRLNLATNFQPDHDNSAEVIVCNADGVGVMRVNFDLDGQHTISSEVFGTVALSHPSIARAILAASDLIDSFFTDEEPVYEVEV